MKDLDTDERLTLDTIGWIAIFVGMFLGIVLICIDLLEEWDSPGVGS